MSNIETFELRILFVCLKIGNLPGGSPNYFCEGLLSNGFVFGSHICSHPSFAPQDLYYNRPHVKSALEELFGVTDYPKPTTLRFDERSEYDSYMQNFSGRADQCEYGYLYEKYIAQSKHEDLIQRLK